MSEITIIRTAGALAEFADAAARVGWLALDTEFLRERTYSPELCLVQVGYDEHAALIDPLAMDDLAPLAALLADANVIKIFHSCRQDLEALDTRMDIQFKNLYDTQLAAAFCGYGEQVSYAALVDELCAVHLAKGQTRTDWSRRPLSDAQLEYALDDVKYLPALRRKLDEMLARNGRAEWHHDECVRAVEPHNFRVDAADAWRRLKGFDRLDAAGQLCARELSAWREYKAQRRNLPRGWILSTPVLLQICRRRPNNVDALANIPDIAAGTVKHAGREIVEMVNRINASAQHIEAETTATSIKALTPDERKRVREIMKFLEERANEQSISRALLTNRSEVENFVRGVANDLPLFSGWRAQFVGDEIRANYSK